ncbi:MAG: ATP-binding protein [Acidobacteriota bacterium]
MQTRRSTRLVTSYVVSLAASITFLVVWVVYVVRSASRIADLGRRVGLEREGLNWLLLAVGCVLLFLLIVGLTYQLAQALAARRYALKQEEFVANITHEMKSPLAAIKLHAQTLQSEDDLAPAVRQRFLTIIEQQADRMSSLVDAVLESSRLLARGRHLELHPVAVAQFCATYFAEVRPKIEGHEVSLNAEIASTSEVLATEEGLRRVFDNLIENAVRFSPQQGEVRCRVESERGLVRFVVEDDGPGIPKKELGSVFDRFYQAPGERGGRRGRGSRGTGLGLSIVLGLVREMHGTVRAISNEGKQGTRMVVELPEYLPTGKAA